MKYVTPKLLFLMFFLVAWFILSPYLFASFTLVLPRAGAKGKGYGTFHEEAVRVFSSLLEQEAIADPIPVIQVRYLVHLRSCISVFFCFFFQRLSCYSDEEFYQCDSIDIDTIYL